jgi:hypothetical protein
VVDRKIPNKQVNNNTFIYLFSRRKPDRGRNGPNARMSLWLWAKIPGWLGIFHFKSKMR